MVPQGFVSGLLLFLIYINDIDSYLCSKICKFADDIRIGYASVITDEVQILRADLNNLAKWATEWKMLFNVKNFVFMHLRADIKNLYNYNMNYVTLKQ